jgi:uncharacterized membrane protein
MNRLRLATACLALAGVAVAGYLTWVHYAELAPVCVGGSDACERVQDSEYAELFGVPVALLGLGGYLALLGSLALPEAVGCVAAAFISVCGAMFSVYLTWVEVAELQAICQWCVVSAALMVVLALISGARLLSGPPPLPSDV